jgi:hypothetical protein
MGSPPAAKRSLRTISRPALLAACRDIDGDGPPWLRSAVLAAPVTGARQGQLMGLSWSDVD